MKKSAFHRLHELRMDNDAAGFAMEEMRPRFLQLANRKENGTAPRAVAVYQLFQTPPAIAAQLADLLELKPGARILEPSAGLGRLLDALQPFAPREVVAVESAADCARELFTQNRERVQIKQRDFLTLCPAELGTFDAVIMNPPFHMRDDIKHIKHAVSFLRPGGRLAAICMHTRHRVEELKRIADMTGGKWIPLPAKSFIETGTKVDCVMLMINREPEPPSEDIMGSEEAVEFHFHNSQPPTNLV